MEEVKDVSKLVFIKARGGRYRWLTISTFLLAIGMILHLFSPSVAGFTPNWMIAMYVVAILLTKPTYKQCVGICLVAALMEVFTSKAAFPYGDFVAEFLGGSIAWVFAHKIPPVKLGHLDFNPSLAAFLATDASGASFVIIMVAVMQMPYTLLLYVMLPAVVVIGICNAVITPFLFFPAQRLLRSMNYMAESEEEDSDHSSLILKQSQPGIISVEHLTYTYPFSKEPALKDVSLSINPGDFVVVTGPNGAGKTTLLMSMAGAIPHYYGGTMKGMVYTCGKAVTQHSIADLASSIGVILSDYKAQIVTLTVEEEMAFTLENHGFPPEEIRRRSRDALKKVHLDGLEKRKISTLSGGQCQRLVVAAVLAEDPKVIVFDEPTSALDPEGIQSFYKIVGELNREQGLTVVVAEHHLEAALPYATRFVLMNDGEIAAEGSPDKVMRQMYENHIYEEAVPSLYRAYLALEKEGYTFNKPFLNIEEAESSVEDSFKEARHA